MVIEFIVVGDIDNDGYNDVFILNVCWVGDVDFCEEVIDDVNVYEYIVVVVVVDVPGHDGFNGCIWFVFLLDLKGC